MATSQKELAVLYVSDVLKLEVVAGILKGLDEEECLAEARKKIGGFLGEKKLQEFEAYILNGNKS